MEAVHLERELRSFYRNYKYNLVYFGLFQIWRLLLPYGSLGHSRRQKLMQNFNEEGNFK